MHRGNLVVSSFHTDDDYYRTHADRLRTNLTELGLRYEIETVEKNDGEDWADICRKKVAFLARVCEKYPEDKVFWVDVDCQVLDFPEYLVQFSADLIGFQRGFGSPLGIGYERRTRFWEPCFFGINTSKPARKFIEDAAHIEKTLRIKATDDYFLEESWRANATAMTFQVIPSGAAIGKGPGGDVPAFFVFGSSGQVSDFKGKVTQHSSARTSGSARERTRRKALRAARGVEKALTAASKPTATRARRWADAHGVTHLLTQAATPTGGTRHRGQLANQMVIAGQRGELAEVRALSARLTTGGIPSAKEVGAMHAAESFASYASAGSGRSLPLAWWCRPFPGNFGDWLSPLVVQRLSGHPVSYVPPTSPTSDPHLVAVGSIGRFIKSGSIVVGTGISSQDLSLEPNAHYISLRGPLTADVLRASGGPEVTSTGDPGGLLRRLIPIERTTTNGRLALVRHFAHANLPITLPDETDELSVLASHPDDLESFVSQLNAYDGVITSAMHVMIACHSYGIPCALIGFHGFEGSVHGTGMKYRDYSLGIGLDSEWDPQFVPLNLRRTNWRGELRAEKISEAKLDEIEAALASAISVCLDGAG
jgi:hypothetical protein